MNEIQRLKQQNELLHQMLEREQADAERARGDLVRRVSTMLEDYSRQRDANLRKAFGAMQDSSAHSEKQWSRLANEQGAKLDVQMQESKDTIALIQRRRQEGKRKPGCSKMPQLRQEDMKSPKPCGLREVQRPP